MTHVYITRTGAKYHRLESCPSLLQLGIKRGYPVPVRRVPLRGRSQQPCTVCWKDDPGYDEWTQLVHTVERDGDSPYEAKFVDLVLRHVRGLRPSDVQVQKGAEGLSGQYYRLDFVVRAQDGSQLAVEIDGTDKAPGCKGIDEIQRDVDAKRTDLRAAGWGVVNYSNDRVIHRSAECALDLESLLSTPLRPGRSLPVDLTPANAAGPGELSSPAPPSWGQTDGDSGPRRSSQAIESKSRISPHLIAAVSLLTLAVIAGGAWLLGVAPEGQVPVPAAQGQSCPSSAPVKGNINDSGERIYHEPGWRYYSATWPEACFESPADAEAADYRRSEVR